MLEVSDSSSWHAQCQILGGLKVEVVKDLAIVRNEGEREAAGPWVGSNDEGRELGKESVESKVVRLTCRVESEAAERGEG